MTQEEILAIKPGNELNMLVAEKVMGHIITKDEIFGYMERSVDPGDGGSVWATVERYSEDLSIAELVVDKMVNLGYEDAIYP